MSSEGATSVPVWFEELLGTHTFHFLSPFFVQCYWVNYFIPSFNYTFISDVLFWLLKSLISRHTTLLYFQTRVAAAAYNATTRIVGGIETGVNEFPMMAGIISLRTRDLVCGATISKLYLYCFFIMWLLKKNVSLPVSNMHALTAAHCLMSESINTIALLAGDHDLTTGVDTPYASLYSLSRVLSHPSFNVATSANDIGLVFTAAPITFNYGVGPACLPFALAANTFAGTAVEATGWGTTTFGGPKVHRLRKVSLDVITNAVCRRSFASLLATNVCTYSMGRDMCQVGIVARWGIIIMPIDGIIPQWHPTEVII